MAYEPKKLNRSLNSTYGEEYHYTTTTDTVAQVTADGYFNDALSLQENRLLTIFASDGVAIRAVGGITGGNRTLDAVNVS